METLFLICATVGGTILLLQFVLLLIGFGGEALDIDIPDDVGGDVDVDFDGDFGGDVDSDLQGHGSTAFFKILSLKTVVAALTFFGLGGLGAQSSIRSPLIVLMIAVAAGFAAMYCVYWMMQSMYRLKSDGTAKVKNAIGCNGTVYLRVPGHESGSGKIQINLQNRTMEFLAMTLGDELPTGAKVVVVDVLTDDTLVVEPILEPERINNDV